MITLEGAQLGLCSPPAPDGVPRTLKKKRRVTPRQDVFVALWVALGLRER